MRYRITIRKSGIMGHEISKQSIAYPYMPAEGRILYVEENDAFIQAAKDFAKIHSLDKAMPNASVLVKDGKIIGQGANGSSYHEANECERIRLNIPTGQGYERCEGCHPKNHSEPKAIQNAIENGHDPAGGEIYLWGHWWCCQPCWDRMLQVGISIVRLLKDSEVLFNKTAPGNIVGQQFA